MDWIEDQRSKGGGPSASMIKKIGARFATLLVALAVSSSFFFGLLFVRSGPPTIGLMLWVLMFPGNFGAGILFPTGIHSGYGEAYLLLSLAINSVVYAFLLRKVLEYIIGRWKQRRPHAQNFPPAHS